MATVPEGDNIYSVQGTVLYRAVDPTEYEIELTETLVDPSVAQSSTRTGTMAVGGSTSMTAKYGPNSILVLGAASAKQQKPSRLAPIGSSQVTIVTPSTALAVGGANSTNNNTNNAAATRSTAAGGTKGSSQQTPPPQGARSAAAVQALDKLFPPCPLNEEGDEIERDPTAADPTTQAQAVARGLGHVASSALVEDMRWLKVASTEHLSRLDVVMLQQHLQNQCEVRQAKPRGTLCTVRENIFEEGQRELIRQITALCPERGLLLDELSHCMDQSTDTYDALFDSACQYAVRKSTERDLRSYLFDEEKTLRSEQRRCENRVHELRAKLDGMTRRFEEQQTATLKMHEDEVNYIKKCNQQIINEIKRIVNLESQ